MSLEAVDFYLHDSSPMEVMLGNVVVKIFSLDGRDVITESTTDLLGHVGFLLPSGVTYQARFYKHQVAFVNPLLFNVLTLPNENGFDVSGDLAEPPTSTDARLCTAFGYFRTATGAPAESVDIHFIPKFSPLLLEGAAVLTERAIIRTDERGYAQVNLIRYGYYDVTVQGFEDHVQQITVPNAPHVNLPDLLFPVVESVSFTPPPPYVLAVDEELLVTPLVVATDGEILGGTASSDVFWGTTDQTVLAVVPCGKQVLLRGLSSGTAFITVKRSNYTIIRYPDLPITGQPALVTVL